MFDFTNNTTDITIKAANTPATIKITVQKSSAEESLTDTLFVACGDVAIGADAGNCVFVSAGVCVGAIVGICVGIPVVICVCVGVGICVGACVGVAVGVGVGVGVGT